MYFLPNDTIQKKKKKKLENMYFKTFWAFENRKTALKIHSI